MSEVRPIPSNDFCRKLYRFDPDLKVTWCDSMGVWQIWHMDRDTKELSHVMSVVNEDGSFRNLDDRVFLVLMKNRWYADHPEELEHDMVDSLIEKAERERKSVKDDLKHLSKDQSLKNEFEKVREKIGFMDKRELTTSRSLVGVDGKPILNAEGKEVKYIPHHSLME